ncbi:MAG: PQQ-binding-like beta-propeller repeat protein, partial [Planctomycetes bacterium]|nr:PQQ-binding-like beta-propeller repeat protein [Planctomycetota bacterium]
MKRIGLLVLALCWLAAEVRGADWFRWRGPEQTGVSREKDLPDHWSPDPQAPNNNLIWKAPYGGRSTPIVMNGRVYLIDSSGAGITSQERIVCFEENTGKVLWEKKFNVWHTDIDILRLGWTNLAGDPETGHLYVHGTQGLFMCLDQDGKVVWSHSLAEEYGRISGYGGRNSSPIVDGDLVILGILNASWGEQAGPGNRWLAVNKHTGIPVWWSASPVRPKDTYASVPVIAVINGERLLITGGGDGAIHALKVRTGEEVWSYMISTGGLSSSPVVDGNLVYICNDGGNYDTNLLGRVMCFDASQVTKGQPKVVWDKPGIEARYTSPLLHEGRLYVADTNARLQCFDGKTGKKLWTFKYGRNAKGSPVWADGKIYVGEVNSRFHILQPGDTNCKELDSVFFPSPNGDVEINGNAAVANGKVFFSTSVETYCIGKKPHQGEAGPAPSLAEETPADASRPTHLQVVPAEVALAPGDSTAFKAQLFDEHGRFLRETQAKWSVAPMQLPPTIKATPPPLKGEITQEGKLT